MAGMETIQRYKIADYLGILGDDGQNSWELMGAGFNTLDENPSAQSDSKTYINDRNSTSAIKSYQTQFPFESDLIKSEKAIMELYKIGRDQATGADAERDYLRVELFLPIQGKENTFKARKFRVSVEVSGLAGAGGETIIVSGNLNSVGNFIDGEFNTQTKIFTENGEEVPPIESLKVLTINSVAGTSTGNTKITVTPTLESENSYKYKTGANVAVPTLDTDCSVGYTAWDGTEEITATKGNKILIVEVNANNKAKKAGITAITVKE
ncbi:TPA: hypothetical protein KO123_003391 [Clostridioides difficile]|nr:hypothetical protein [Clostridioides difficile]MDE3612280.1 hypothetical protein [Clostridioides difficile]MDM9793443.1 hypothetical protein [Clostridioides difficile]HBF8686597.1 hypothetical protein [Clostridioides difficile]